ncbi:MAG: hypothetical protein ACYDBS_08635, partial [Acidimicrobiales bacterium]
MIWVRHMHTNVCHLAGALFVGTQDEDEAGAGRPLSAARSGGGAPGSSAEPCPDQPCLCPDQLAAKKDPQDC